MRSGSWVMLVLLAPALACSTPVGVRRVAPRDVHRALSANVLSTGRPSAASAQILDRFALFELYEDDPDAAIQALRGLMLAKVERGDLLAALAELEFHRGQRLGRRDGRPHFLAAAVYAHRGMASLTRSPKFVALDPRFRLLADLYNRGLTSGLAADDGLTVDLGPRTLALSFGELVLESDPDELIWGGYRMKGFVPVAELEVRGLRSRYRKPGLGAPLAASLEPAELEAPPRGFGHLSLGIRVAATAVVEFQGGGERLEGDAVTGTLSLHTLDDATAVPLGDHLVALEYEPTAALALALAESRPWDFELRGFLSGDFGSDRDRGLRMLSPYDPARIPVVLVHGTASSPARWAEMINHLQADSAVLSGYQFWMFQYNTGNPVPFSAGLFRQALIDLVAELDPEGDDEKLRRMVVIGHSQGGLLTRLCVVESGDVFWNNVSSVPIDELDLQPATRETLERSLFFYPLPFVERVIFIATPHRGSFLASRWLGRFASRLAGVPGELVEVMGDLFAEDDDRILLQGLDDMPSSIDHMNPDAPFIRSLAGLPIAPGVEAHSIIAVQSGDDEETAHDGVVTLQSARIEGVRSELIVRSGHSTQSHPTTIGEVRRILHAGLEDGPAVGQDARPISAGSSPPPSPALRRPTSPAINTAM